MKTLVAVGFLLFLSYFGPSQGAVCNDPPSTPNAAWQCISFAEGRLCLVSCKKGFKISSQVPTMYVCYKSDGNWTTTTGTTTAKWPDCIPETK
ncbi:hypothetical protein AC249_AIPGENE4229 [Exaiptasia diaphana]|nr:hypothetical protein AC249_AIPGENE4229 [Exaiptasia diaphana]